MKHLKYFLRRVNRGIMLGIVLLLGLSIYFVVDARAFEREMDDIQATLLAFTAATQQLNATLASDTSAAYQRQAVNAFLEEYFVEFRRWPRNHWMRTSRQEAVYALDDILAFPPGHFTGCVELTLTELSNMRKQATNAVQLTFVMRVTPPEGMHTTYFNGFFNASSSVGFFDSIGGFAMIDSGNELRVEAIMLRSGGQWRFADVTVWSGNHRLGPIFHSFTEVAR